jgi:large subunit ribosomal protein L9
MDVILREHVDNLGRRGEIVKVADGYARNFLLPRKLALAVTEANKKQIEREREAAEARELEEKAQAEAYGQRLTQTAIEIAPCRREQHAVRVGHVGRHRALAARFEIDKRKIQLPEPLKALGEVTVPVKVHREVTAQVKVTIVAAQR